MSICSFCGIYGHNIKSCNDQCVDHLLDLYKKISNASDLLAFFCASTTSMLSIIMLDYNSCVSVSISKKMKEKFIREHWLVWLAKQQEDRLYTRVYWVSNNSTYNPEAIINVVEEIAEISAELKTKKDRLNSLTTGIYNFICEEYVISNNDDIITSLFHSFYTIFKEIATIIIEETSNNVNESFTIGKLILKKLNVIDKDYKIILFNEIRRKLYDQTVRRILAEDQASFKPTIAPIKISKIKDDVKETDVTKDKEDYSCGICSEEFLTNTTIPNLGCGHMLCYDCVKGMLVARTKSFISCPFCREEISKIYIDDDNVRVEMMVLFVTN